MRWGLLLVLGAVVFVTPLSAASTPAGLPDLAVTPLDTVLVERAADGTRRLRFTVSIANVGKAPIEVVASRPSRGADWAASQRISRADGSSYLVSLPSVRMAFVGLPEHGHWHVRGAARYELRRLGERKALRIHVKRGFCLYDSNPYRRSLPGAPAKRAYPRDACGKKRELSLAMGVSVGWRDDYYWRIPGQAFDVTTLPQGKYRLVVRVDPRNWFRESNERNNQTWVDIHIGETSVKVLRHSKRV